MIEKKTEKYLITLRKRTRTGTGKGSLLPELFDFNIKAVNSK